MIAIVCDDCGAVLQDGPVKRISHGKCFACTAAFFRNEIGIEPEEKFFEASKQPDGALATFGLGVFDDEVVPCYRSVG